MSGQFDFLVIGDDEASFCAAACAAKAGAHVGHLKLSRRKKQSAGAAAPAVPNFVWRRLELQNYDLTLEPASARVTLFKEGQSIVTYANPRETRDALAARDIPDHDVWVDFVEEVSALANGGFAEPGRGAPLSGKSFAGLLTDPNALARAARLYGSCAELADDYFTDENLQAHVSAHALAPGGAGGEDAGTARALAEFFDEDSWRVRTPDDSPPLLRVLSQVAKDAGVVGWSGRLKEIAREGAKSIRVHAGDEEDIKTRFVFFSTPDAAIAAGAADLLAGGPRAKVTVRFKLSNRPEPPAGDEKSIFQIIDNAEDINAASAAAVKGELFEGVPVEFEYAANGEIIAHTAYFPAAFYEDGDWRGWTGQDRQAAAAIVKNRIASRLPDFAAAVRGAQTEVEAPGARRREIGGWDRVVIQPHRHNAISAAVKLIDKVMLRDE
ncbi:hypothetical protein [Hyphococcus sp.]|uniref:hypothetical protein n=1 Tax=Hyphococcus sp. TaxID=2038636 RepID=UPI003CCC3381